MRARKDDLNAPSSSLRQRHLVRGFYETQGTSRSSLIPWAADRTCDAFCCASLTRRMECAYHHIMRRNM